MPRKILRSVCPLYARFESPATLALASRFEFGGNGICIYECDARFAGARKPGTRTETVVRCTYDEECFRNCTYFASVQGAECCFSLKRWAHFSEVSLQVCKLHHPVKFYFRKVNFLILFVFISYGITCLKWWIFRKLQLSKIQYLHFAIFTQVIHHIKSFPRTVILGSYGIKY